MFYTMFLETGIKLHKTIYCTINNQKLNIIRTKPETEQNEKKKKTNQNE